MKLYSRGDTIVEVLIAIVVVSSVLGGAFTSVRSSTKATRSAQEQGEALKLAESQVEQIKIAAETGVPNLATATPPFCINGATTPSTTPAAGSAACSLIRGLYNIAITEPAPDVYATQVSWDGLSGNTNRVELDYKAR